MLDCEGRGGVVAGQMPVKRRILSTELDRNVVIEISL